MSDLFKVKPLKMFACTLRTHFKNMQFTNFVDFSTRICTASDHPNFICINSNYGHYCKPGYESFIKSKTKKKNKSQNMAERKAQGDASCFNTAIEPILTIEPTPPGVTPGKVYKIKCFPPTGQIQIPGVLNLDFSDGRAIMEIMLDYIKSELHRKFSTAITDFPVVTYEKPAPPKLKVSKYQKKESEAEYIMLLEKMSYVSPYNTDTGTHIISTRPERLITPEEIDALTYEPVVPILINYKFMFEIDSRHVLVIGNLFNILHSKIDATETQTIPMQINDQTISLTIEPEEIIAPREGTIVALRNVESGRVTFIMQRKIPIHEADVATLKKPKVKKNGQIKEEKFVYFKPRVNIFQSGKVNILGLKRHEDARIIYEYLVDIFTVYQEYIIVEKQMPDENA